ncbi:MAG: transketolase [Parachlamydiales bacterium]|nr:transketolase [Parachlamydiales bacterium]
MDEGLKKTLSTAANTIRGLSMDGVQKANSGHPGLPLGCAELGAYLYGCVLKQNPKDSQWLNRDRLVLSAGHGSMWLYSCLHLSGFNLSLDDLKKFRQLKSKTPGHPEFHMTDGVEATTGPLGQGVGNAIGQAFGIKLLADKFNTDKHQLFTSKVYCLAGDGCMMEGVSNEACSFAGHIGLNNIVLMYDYNNITLDGPRSDSCSEDVHVRFKGYGWDVYETDGYDFDEMERLFKLINQKQERPAIIIVHTIIGKGAATKAGTHKVHGAPLGPDEVAASKKMLGLPAQDFYVPEEVYAFFDKHTKEGQELEAKWKQTFQEWSLENPELAKDFDLMLNKKLPDDLESRLNALTIKSPIAGRSASNEVLAMLGDMLPFLYGGSADLSGSDMTMMKKFGIVSPGSFKGRNIKYGVREFGMATIATGLAQTQMILPYIGTFLTFSDYMRNAIRLAALSHTHVVYQFTHDSIFLGEDGPTHQSVEHYASLRAIPNLHFIRPADSNEVKMGWIAALKYEGPTAFSLSRQNLPELECTRVPFKDGVGRGAYIIKKEQGDHADIAFFATGSEVSLALDAAKELEKRGKKVRVVSMPCWELFEKQSDDYKKSILCGDFVRVAVEAGVSQGWHRFIGWDGITITMKSFGESAPAEELAKYFGFTVEAIVEKVLKAC